MQLINLPQDWLDSWKYSTDIFQTVFGLKGEIFREQPGRKTLKFTKFNHNYFLKLHYGVGWREIFKNLLQLKHPVLGAQNEVKAIQKLAQHQFTPLLIGYGWRGENPATQQSFVITQELENTISLEDYCKHWKTNPPAPPEKWNLIKKTATLSKIMHDNGVNHRDFYICHFLLNTQNNNNLYIIDWHRAQTRKKTPVRWKIKDLAGLYFSAMDIGLTRRDCWRFIKIYDSDYNSTFWRLVIKRAKKLYRKVHKRDPEHV